MTININKILGQQKVKFLYTLLDFDGYEFDNRPENNHHLPLYCQRLWVEDKDYITTLQHQGVIYCAFNPEKTIQLYTRAADRKDAQVRLDYRWLNQLEFHRDNYLREPYYKGAQNEI